MHQPRWWCVAYVAILVCWQSSLTVTLSRNQNSRHKRCVSPGSCVSSNIRGLSVFDFLLEHHSTAAVDSVAPKFPSPSLAFLASPCSRFACTFIDYLMYLSRHLLVLLLVEVLGLILLFSLHYRSSLHISCIYTCTHSNGYWLFLGLWKKKHSEYDPGLFQIHKWKTLSNQCSQLPLTGILIFNWDLKLETYHAVGASLTGNQPWSI